MSAQNQYFLFFFYGSLYGSDSTRNIHFQKLESAEYAIIAMITGGGLANNWLNKIFYQFCKIASDDSLTIPISR